MGLTAALSNSLSGMNTTQRGLEILSRNVANAGTPGYHKQSLAILESLGAESTYARSAGVKRAYSEALQRSYNQQMSAAGYADTLASTLAMLEPVLGMPGDDHSLDTAYSKFENALRAVATSPDDFASRAQMIAAAQDLAQTFNGLSDTIQGLRQETESQLASNVTDLNRMLKSLEEVNGRLGDNTINETSRSSLLDERDRLIAGVSELVDTQVVYRKDDTVALYTSAGLGLLDVKATTFEFQSAGVLGATSKFAIADSENGVGQLLARTPSGLKIDVFDQGLIRSGRIGALVDLRDNTLVQAQAQIDQIAAGIATALSTVEAAGTAATSGAASGFGIDTTNLAAGNEIILKVVQGGQPVTVRVVRVDDTSKLPMDYAGPDGARVIGINFSAGAAAAATQLGTALGSGFAVTNPSGNLLQVLDDGASNVTNVTAMTSRTTVTGAQGAGLAVSLFVDGSGTPFTNSRDGDPQLRGFAGRISVNSAIVSDNSLLVQYASGGTLGDAARPNFMLQQLEGTSFSGDPIAEQGLGSFRLQGNVRGLISQVLNFQGGAIESANSNQKTREFSLQAVQQRMDSEFGVNVDEEMARLMELQNSYAASARVISVVQELINALMQI